MEEVPVAPPAGAPGDFRNGTQDGLRDGLRLLTIVRRLLPTALSLLRDRHRWLRSGPPVPRSAAFHERRARNLVRQLAALGPGFVKLAQIFASRSDLIAEPYLSALGTLTDRVPPVPWPRMREVLADAWGQDPDAVLQHLDAEPLAAGSLGQVHRARYRDLDVVVKILRPGVGAIVDRDVRIARRMVDAVYARFPHHHILGFRVVLDEFALHVPEEMDFEREGDQCARMRHRFRDEPRLRIPLVHAELTRREVLVMEYLPGTRIDQLQARVERGEISVLALVETLIESYARMMLRDGVFHADPHPGNLLVDDRGRIILLDFGMVIEVGVETRKALFDTIIAAVQRDVDATATGFFALGLVAPGTSHETMVALVRALLEIAFAETAMHARSRALAERIMKELFDWPVVLPGELVYFARTAALIEGVGARYDKNFNGIRVASPVVLRLRHELLLALLGKDAADPVVMWAATMGAVAGGAAAVISQKSREFAQALTDGWQSLFNSGGPNGSSASATLVPRLVPSATNGRVAGRLEDPLAKEVEAELHAYE